METLLNDSRLGANPEPGPSLLTTRRNVLPRAAHALVLSPVGPTLRGEAEYFIMSVKEESLAMLRSVRKGRILMGGRKDILMQKLLTWHLAAQVP